MADDQIPSNPIPGSGEDDWGYQLNSVLDALRGAVGSLRTTQAAQTAAIAELRAAVAAGGGGGTGPTTPDPTGPITTPTTYGSGAYGSGSF